MIAIMSERGLRERKRTPTRQATLDATLPLVEARGCDATRVDQVAADATPSTFLRSFPTEQGAELRAAGQALRQLPGDVYERDRHRSRLRMRRAFDVLEGGVELR